MKRERRSWLTMNTLRYLADHMSAIVDVDCGIWNETESAEESELVRALVKREAGKIRARGQVKP